MKAFIAKTLRTAATKLENIAERLDGANAAAKEKAEALVARAKAATAASVATLQATVAVAKVVAQNEIDLVVERGSAAPATKTVVCVRAAVFGLVAGVEMMSVLLLCIFFFGSTFGSIIGFIIMISDTQNSIARAHKVSNFVVGLFIRKPNSVAA